MVDELHTCVFCEFQDGSCQKNKIFLFKVPNSGGFLIKQTYSDATQLMKKQVLYIR